LDFFEDSACCVNFRLPAPNSGKSVVSALLAEEFFEPGEFDVHAVLELKLSFVLY
jgi:hypothetical protein